MVMLGQIEIWGFFKMKILKAILDFLLEIVKILAGLIRSLQKDDALTIESDGQKKKVVIPKSIIIAFIGFLTTVAIFILKT